MVGMIMKLFFISKLKHFFRQLYIFVLFVGYNFSNDGCSYRAGALAFATLLAIVPLMSIGLSILSSFPIFLSLKTPLQDFIFTNFVPTTGHIVQIYLEQFTQQVSRLSMIGVFFLLITAILVMSTIERAMNTIWRVHIQRHGFTAILLYWSILSLTPLFLGLSLLGSSYLTSLPILFNHQLPPFLFNVAPYLLSFIGFTFLYVVLPNHPVKLTHGMCGALIATILFESAKLGFTFYLSNYNFYALLYGAFATLPIFFIWIYWVWLITLLGAEVTYAMSVNLEHHDSTEALPGFVHVLLWLQELWHAQQDGHGLRLEELTDLSKQPYAIEPKEMIDLLSHEKLIHLAVNHEYRLSKNIGSMTLYQLSHHLPYRLPIESDLDDLAQPFITSWKAKFKAQQPSLQSALNIRMEELFLK